MLSASIRSFIRDESGGYTIWSLIWFSLYVAMGGLAVDITDAYRTRTQLQATADSAALAGVMSLPNTADAVSAAVGFAESNMPVPVNGFVLDPGDVLTGNWDAAADKFTAGGTPQNAVYVLARRANENANPLATNFLRILSIWGLPLDRWNINTDAVAITFVPGCLLENGFVAGNRLSVQSNNVTTNTCFHAQNMRRDNAHQDLSVDLSNQNTFGPGTVVSMPDLGGLDGRNNLCDQNTGLCDPGVLVEGDMWPQDVKNLPAIIAALRTGARPYTPDYMFLTADVGGVSVEVPPTILSGDPSRNGQLGVTYDPKYNENFAGPFLPHHIYDIRCSNASKTLNLPKTLPLANVVIVSNCKIGGANGGTITSGVIASSAVGSGGKPLDAQTISLAGGWNLGDATFCDGGYGKVGVYAYASAHIAAGQTVYGVRVVVGGNLEFTANGNTYGVSAQAGADIAASTSNGSFSYCAGSFDPDTFARSFRLVR